MLISMGVMVISARLDACKRLVVSLLCSFWLCAEVHAVFQVDIFYVGQGNCTVISCPHGHPLMVDAGSSQYRGRGTRQMLQDSILTRLGGFLPQVRGGIDLTVIASHGDNDHTNWIKDVIEQLKERFYQRDLNVRFLLGGCPDDYVGDNKKDFKDFVEGNDNVPRDGPLYISQHYEEQEQLAAVDPQQVISRIVPPGLNLDSGDVRVRVLAAINSDFLEEGLRVNTNSIVLQVVYGNHAIILPGDATGETTDRILAAFTRAGRLDDLKSSILVSSHHGAHTHGSNNIAWIMHVAPRYFVNSSGTHEHHLHPKTRAIENAIQFSPNIRQGVNTHSVQSSGSLTYGEQGGFTLKPDQPDPDYNIFSTSLGVYNTTNQGTISFSWTQNQDAELLNEPDCEFLDRAIQLTND